MTKLKTISVQPNLQHPKVFNRLPVKILEETLCKFDAREYTRKLRVSNLSDQMDAFVYDN